MGMHSLSLPHSIAAGFASAALLLCLSLLQPNIMLGVFCIVPVLYLGMKANLQHAALSLCVASALLLGFSSHLAMFYLLVVAVPALLVLASIRAYRPVVSVLSEVVLYAMLLAALLQFRTQESGGIQGAMQDAFDTRALDMVDPAMVEQLSWMMHEVSFLFIGLGVWFVCLLLYASLWICSALLRNSSINMAPFIRMDTSNPPQWVGIGLIILCLFSMLLGDFYAYLAKLNFVIILLPYVFSGAMYTPLRKWQGMQSGWSVLVYTLAFLLTWPAVIFAFIGVLKHLQAILKK